MNHMGTQALTTVIVLPIVGLYRIIVIVGTPNVEKSRMQDPEGNGNDQQSSECGSQWLGDKFGFGMRGKTH